MGEYFTQLDFSQIASQPHRLLDKAVKKLPMFTGSNATTSAMHLRSFSRCVNGFINDPAHQHDDVYMKLFALSLEGRAGDWYSNLLDNSFATLKAFKTAFTNRFGEKEPRHQLAALTNIKNKENETMDDFNQRFTELSNAIPST